jgi:DNA-binding NarL/FixJ family response regulator
VAKRRGVVCLASANPLALAELERMVAARLPLRIQSVRLNLESRTAVLEGRLPRATVYVVDAWSTGQSTEAVVAGLRSRYPNARIVVLVPKLTEAGGFSLLRLGVKGIVAHKVARTHLARAIVAVANGGVWTPRSLVSNFLDQVLGQSRNQSPQSPRLSYRERQVIDCVLKSLSNKEIADSLHISESTVKFHLRQLFHKFGVRRRADLILQSIQQPVTLVH